MNKKVLPTWSSDLRLEQGQYDVDDSSAPGKLQRGQFINRLYKKNLKIFNTGGPTSKCQNGFQPVTNVCRKAIFIVRASRKLSFRMWNKTFNSTVYEFSTVRVYRLRSLISVSGRHNYPTRRN